MLVMPWPPRPVRAIFIGRAAACRSRWRQTVRMNSLALPPAPRMRSALVSGSLRARPSTGEARGSPRALRSVASTRCEDRERDRPRRPSCSVMPRTPVEVRLWNSRTSSAREADRLALAGGRAARRPLRSSSATPISRSSPPSPSNFMAILPFEGTLAKASMLLRRTEPLAVANMTWRLAPVRPRPRGAGSTVGDRLALGERQQQVDHRPAAWWRARPRAGATP